jgi:hypothetical protein
MLMLASSYQRRVFGDGLAEQIRLHDAVLNEAHRIAALGWDEEASKRYKLARKLANCCANPLIYAVDDDDKLVFSECRCKSRVCVRCRKIRQNTLTASLSTYARTIDAPRFLTLTQASTNAPLRDELKRMRAAFAKLRRTRLWRDHVVGGFYCVEVTWNATRQQWHPHLHALIDGTFIPQKDLAEEWERITGDSSIVDIRACHDRKRAVRYVASYVAKSSDVSRIPTEVVAEWAMAVHGLRFVAKFGTLHAVKAEPEDERDHHTDWRIIVPAVALQDAADGGDAEAATLLLWSQQREGHRVPLVRQGAEPEAPPSDRDLLGRLRAWWSRRQELARGPPADARISRGDDRPHHRQLRFGQDVDDRPRR